MIYKEKQENYLQWFTSWGNRLQHSCLENLMDSGAWWATVHGGHKKLDMIQWLNNNNVLKEKIWRKHNNMLTFVKFGWHLNGLSETVFLVPFLIFFVPLPLHVYICTYIYIYIYIYISLSFLKLFLESRKLTGLGIKCLVYIPSSSTR